MATRLTELVDRVESLVISTLALAMTRRDPEQQARLLAAAIKELRRVAEDTEKKTADSA